MHSIGARGEKDAATNGGMAGLKARSTDVSAWWEN
jgi:hypothetical protein